MSLFALAGLPFDVELFGNGGGRVGRHARTFRRRQRGDRRGSPYVWLRVSRLGGAYAFHSSLDGARWDFVRHFEIGPVDNHRVGLEVQSPMGDGCDAVFTELTWSAERLADLRSGV